MSEQYSLDAVKREEPGNGTLRWRDRGRRWELRFQVEGERQSEYFSVAQFGGKEQAKRAADRRRKALAGRFAENVLVITRDTPLEQFAEDWVARQVHLEETTRREYAGRLVYLLSMYPTASVKLLGSGDALSALFQQLQQRGYAPKTIAHVHHVVGLLIDAALTRGYISRNPLRVEKIRRPRLTPREYRIFSVSELDSMMRYASARNSSLESVVSLIGLCGLRPGEALALQWNDIEGEWLHVRRSGRRETTKTAAGRRMIRMPESTVESIRRLRSRSSGSVELFPGLSVNAFGDRFRRLQRNCKVLPLGRPYDLRHTAITHAIAYADRTPGVSIADVAKWAGHSRNSTTLDTYCHVLPSSPGLSDVVNAAYMHERAAQSDS